MSEKSEIKRDGAFAQKNSGRGKHRKGDAILDGIFMVDYKEYERSFGISLDVWAKTCTDAYVAGNYEPLLKVILGKGGQKIRLVIMAESTFNDMKEVYINDQGMV